MTAEDSARLGANRNRCAGSPRWCSSLLHTGAMDALRWLRVVGDTVFAIGIFVFVAAIVG